MPWKQISPGSWERALDNNELLLKSVFELFKPLNKEHWAVNIVAIVDSLPDTEAVAALRGAWI